MPAIISQHQWKFQPKITKEKKKVQRNYQHSYLSDVIVIVAAHHYHVAVFLLFFFHAVDVRFIVPRLDAKPKSRKDANPITSIKTILALIQSLALLAYTLCLIINYWCWLLHSKRMPLFYYLEIIGVEFSGACDDYTRPFTLISNYTNIFEDETTTDTVIIIVDRHEIGGYWWPQPNIQSNVVFVSSSDDRPIHSIEFGCESMMNHILFTFHSHLNTVQVNGIKVSLVLKSNTISIRIAQNKRRILLIRY